MLRPYPLIRNCLIIIYYILNIYFLIWPSGPSQPPIPLTMLLWICRIGIAHFYTSLIYVHPFVMEALFDPLNYSLGLKGSILFTSSIHRRPSVFIEYWLGLPWKSTLDGSARWIRSPGFHRHRSVPQHVTAYWCSSIYIGLGLRGRFLLVMIANNRYYLENLWIQTIPFL